jgi:hypothetical protein
MTCPLCGSTLSLMRVIVSREYAPPFHTRTHPVPTREHRVWMLTCNGCEYAARVEQARKL